MVGIGAYGGSSTQIALTACQGLKHTDKPALLIKLCGLIQSFQNNIDLPGMKACKPNNSFNPMPLRGTG